MPLLARTVLAPLAIDVRRGALARLGAILADRRISTDGGAAVVVGPGLGDEITRIVHADLPAARVYPIAAGTLDNALDLGRELRSRPFDVVIGIGGGRVIDTVKFAASQQGLPMVAVATSLAHDGIASPVAVLERDGASVSYGVHIPLATIVDLDFVRRSPARQTISGIGDALSNLSAVADWELAHEHTGEPLDGLAVALARTGAEALLTHPGGLDDDDFLATLANALLLGGMAMAVAGSSRPCSGGCHEISHAISRLHPGVATHGEQVGLGALFCSWLRGSPRLDDLAAAYVRHGLPRVPADLGLSVEQFAAAVALAPSTRPGRYTILEHLHLDENAIRDRVDTFVAAMPPRPAGEPSPAAEPQPAGEAVRRGAVPAPIGTGGAEARR